VTMPVTMPQPAPAETALADPLLAPASTPAMAETAASALPPPVAAPPPVSMPQPSFAAQAGTPPPPTEVQIKPLWLVEKEAIDSAILSCGGNIPRAAQLLEISPSTIYRKRQAWEAQGLTGPAVSGGRGAVGGHG